MSGISYDNLPAALRPKKTQSADPTVLLQKLVDKLAPDATFQPYVFNIPVGNSIQDTANLNANGLIIEVDAASVLVTLNNNYSFLFNVTNPYNMFFPSMQITNILLSNPSTNSVAATGRLYLVQY